MPRDEDAIAALVHRYAELLDEGDLDGVAGLFETAVWRSSWREDGPEQVLRGRDEVRRAYDPVILYGGLPRTKHVITNLVVEVGAGGDTGSSRSYFTVLQAAPGGPLQPIIAGRYHDRFEKAGGGWRFTERVIRPDLIGDLSGHYR